MGERLRIMKINSILRKVILLSLILSIYSLFCATSFAGSQEVGFVLGKWVRLLGGENLIRYSAQEFDGLVVKSLKTIEIDAIRLAAIEGGDSQVLILCEDLARLERSTDKTAHLLSIYNRYGSTLSEEERFSFLGSIEKCAAASQNGSAARMISLESLENGNSIWNVILQRCSLHNMSVEALRAMRSDLIFEKRVWTPPLRALLAEVGSCAFSMESSIVRQLIQLEEALERGRVISSSTLTRELYRSILPNIMRLQGRGNPAFLAKLIAYKRLDERIDPEREDIQIIRLTFDRYALLEAAMEGEATFGQALEALATYQETSLLEPLVDERLGEMRFHLRGFF